MKSYYWGCYQEVTDIWICKRFDNMINADTFALTGRQYMKGTKLISSTFYVPYISEFFLRRMLAPTIIIKNKVE